MAKAHLILRVESQGPDRPPFIVSAGIFDEGPETFTLGHKTGTSFCEVYQSGEHSRLDDAIAEVHAFLKDKGWGWCERLIAQGSTGVREWLSLRRMEEWGPIDPMSLGL